MGPLGLNTYQVGRVALPMDLWTIPSDQPKPFGTWGRTVDNKKAVAHSSTTLLCLSTTGPTGSICKYYNFDKNAQDGYSGKYPRFWSGINII